MTHWRRHEGPTTYAVSFLGVEDPSGPRDLPSGAGPLCSEAQRPMLWSWACTPAPGADRGPHREQSDSGPAASPSLVSRWGGRTSSTEDRQGRRPAAGRVQGDSGIRWSQWLVVARKAQTDSCWQRHPPRLSTEDSGGELGPGPVTVSCHWGCWDPARRPPHPQGSQCLPAEASGARQGPLALLVPTSKATHPPSCPCPGGSQCPVVGTSCECAAAAREQSRSRGGAWCQQLEGELRRAERPGGKAQ